MALDNLNDVSTIVSLDGTKVHYTDLVLCQGFNCHHTFTVTLHHEALEPLWMGNPKQVFSLTGKNIQITFRHKITGEQNVFAGIVRKVTYAGKHGVNNNIVISGGSPTLKLDGNPTMDSFAEQSLRTIVDYAVSNSGNGVEVRSSPKFDQKITYLCQYGETCFGFLDRLSRMYGEWFYYNGKEILFGKPDSLETVELIYDVHIRKMELSVQAVPHSTGMYEYIRQAGDKFDAAATPMDVDASGYAQLALARSGEFYPSEGMVPSRVPVSSQTELSRTVVNHGRMRSLGEMLVLEGESIDCRVGIGKILEVKLPRTMSVDSHNAGRFLIGRITHRADAGGKYSNEFTAYTEEAGCVPLRPMVFPFAGPQPAVVTDNSDSKGRVKVKFQWQQVGNKSTNWIRVQTPDGGTSSKGTRGFTFVPEIDDQVMVGFEYGSPDRPYVMGSVFSTDVGQGGGEGNKSKSLVSRSGSALKLDDASGSVRLQDPGKSSMDMDGAGTTKIDSSEKIILTCGSSSLELHTDGKILINGKDLKIDVETTIEEETKSHSITGIDSIKLRSDTLIEEKAAKVSTEASHVTVHGKAGVDIESPAITTIKGSTSLNLN